MRRKEVLAERKALEDFYYNCKLETPQEVATLFEVYTKLIWNHHLAGLVYDYYCDDTTLNHEGAEKMVGGVDVTELHTIPSFAAFPRNKTHFEDIFCVGDAENGYKFGQITTHSGIYPKEGFGAKGRGTDFTFPNGSEYCFCQCLVKKVNGRWAVTDEFLGFGEEFLRHRVSNSRPFLTTLLEDVWPAEPAAEGCCCECCEPAVQTNSNQEEAES